MNYSFNNSEGSEFFERPETLRDLFEEIRDIILHVLYLLWLSSFGFYSMVNISHKR
jgi:hypothetical protein